MRWQKLIAASGWRRRRPRGIASQVHSLYTVPQFGLGLRSCDGEAVREFMVAGKNKRFVRLP